MNIGSTSAVWGMSRQVQLWQWKTDTLTEKANPPEFWVTEQEQAFP